MKITRKQGVAIVEDEVITSLSAQIPKTKFTKAFYKRMDFEKDFPNLQKKKRLLFKTQTRTKIETLFKVLKRRNRQYYLI